MRSKLIYPEQYNSNSDFPDYDGKIKPIVLAATPRSGSHFLGHLLYKTEKFGFPLEYINRRNFYYWKKRFKSSDTIDTINKIKKKRTSPNGVFSIKLHYRQLSLIGGFKSLLTLFPELKIILLERRDLLGQAISYVKAKQTDLWISGEQQIKKPKYSFEEIVKAISIIFADKANWEMMLSIFNIDYLSIYHEDVKENYQMEIEKIFDYCSLKKDYNRNKIVPITKSQADQTNHVWREQFVHDINNSNDYRKVEVLSSYSVNLMHYINKIIR